MLKIHGVPVSVHTRKVLVAALHKGIDFELVPVVPIVPETLPANWREISPTSKVPVLSDGDFHLADSAAICAYLERLQPLNPLYPRNDREYARALSIEQYAGALFAEVVHPLFFETYVNPNMRMQPADLARVGALETQVAPPMLAHLDRIADGGFFVGKTLSVADIAVVSNLLNLRYLGFKIDSARYPRLVDLFERALREPAFQKALSRELPVAQSMGFGHDVIAAALN
jgi:glutathione S-transferase